MNTQTQSQAGFAEATGPTGTTPTSDPAPHPPGEADPIAEARPTNEAHPTTEAVDAKGRPLAVVPARVPWLEIGIFAVAAFGLAWLACLPLWFSAEGIGDPALLLTCGSAMMFTPLIASILASIVQRRRARARGEILASAPRYFGFWPLRSFGRVIGMTIASFFGIMVLVVLGYLVSAAFVWLSLDLDGLSGFNAQLEAMPGMDSLPTAAAIAIYLLLMFVSSVANIGVTIGEEFGWRGWLLTSLRPLGTWPALVAAQTDYELTALGISGQCHLDPPLAETVGRSRPDLVTLCLGANIYGAATFTERSLLPAMIGFVDHVRRLTPAPIVLMSTITSGPHREDVPNAAGLTQRRLRELLHHGAELLRREDPLITLIDGSEIIAAQEMHLLGDLLHPTPEGYRVMAERLAPRLARALADASGTSPGAV